MNLYHYLQNKLWKYRWKRIRKARKRGIQLKIPLKIPSALITGSVGKTTTCRMLAFILDFSGYKVALSTSQGTFIGNEAVRTGDSSNCKYASKLLLNRNAQAAVFELARGGLLDQGVVFDKNNVAALLNVHDNHLGLGGINSRAQMADLKSQVVKAATDMAVLNADDALCLKVRPDLHAAHVCLVSMSADNAAVQNHLNADGYAIFADNAAPAVIHFYRGDALIGRLPAAEIPATLNGNFRPGIVNAMFAIALAYGMGLDFEKIRAAICRFISDSEHNPGRMNFFDGLPFKLLVTTCDGPIAAHELARYMRNQTVAGEKTLLFDAAGDRSDDFILSTSQAFASAFDTFICCDFPDLRGRVPMQVANLLKTGLLNCGINDEKITVATSYEEALETAFTNARAGDFLVIENFYGLKSAELEKLLKKPPPERRELSSV